MVEMQVPDGMLARGLRTVLHKGPRSVSVGMVGPWHTVVRTVSGMDPEVTFRTRIRFCKDSEPLDRFA